ncbi:PLK/SAK protein kinase [Thecamonas trahens ATCC 50062]|uniref:PLK/SAK protein kinase n=1 Tax=Thecamonas trahens ATCC 50062 TaxID=461836 RepID=A0A0L0DQE2_THETB|nr:PLK/SAK protein kinase [Thecamonas trahens ATCC 50062]KNC54490.1 PLK/SAK protein kinase [Thecamonas trahens ATCC 50062]|eukprot:XP_013753643.1 PLK/SAK protein kinase [Thecamonas trahens ATCC 50062]
MTGRIVSEVSIHAQIEHPGVVPLLAFEEDDRFVYLVLPLAEGTLAEAVADLGGLMDEQTAGACLAQITDAVAYLHAHGVLHRDLKLTNILVMPQHASKAKEKRTGWKLMVADFGLAAKVDSPHDARATRCGTPNYMAPEVACALPHSSAADVWALGVLAYTLLVGRPPFSPSDAAEARLPGVRGARATLAKVKRGKYVLPDTVSPLAADFISACLRHRPEDRPTAAQLVAHPFLAGPVTVSPGAEWDALVYGSPSKVPGLYASITITVAVAATVATPPVAPLVPLDARGVTCVRVERTAFGSVSVLPNSEVGVEVVPLNAILLVACDGTAVRVGQLDKAAELGGGLERTTYGLEHLPVAAHPYYDAAREYVARVRAATPKVTLHTPLGVFSLSAAGAYGARFGDGFEMSFKPGHNSYELADGTSVSAHLRSAVAPPLAARLEAFDAARAALDRLEAEECAVFPLVAVDPLLGALGGDASAGNWTASSSASTTSASSSSASSSGRAGLSPPVHVPGTGWAFRDGGANMHLLFDDGVHVEIPASATTVRMTSVDGGALVFSLDAVVPPEVRARLAHVPAFANALRSQRQPPASDR